MSAITCVTGVAISARWYNIWAATGADALSAPDAHRAAISGAVLLVDIRRPDEWARTGVGEGALPLDMRQRAFTDLLSDAVDGDHSRAIALICARGVRSRGMAGRLRAAGFTRIIDVPEGMLGSGAGPGWIKRGLPLRKEG
ncbi:rhodanese-like domain-containing protein [uncultured Roseobacter sp.]|uniref:rhodanese-like domain-containing protein n=1 Tax=uncultured Roseobacter sp. TaxID=114847 RepID=UPI00261ABB53|nr:rhodanese-like domain-containing protein [uncultured Roseobacter sp.]